MKIAYGGFELHQDRNWHVQTSLRGKEMVARCLPPLDKGIKTNTKRLLFTHAWQRRGLTRTGSKMESTPRGGPRQRGSAKCSHCRQHGATVLTNQHDDGNGNRSRTHAETGRRSILWNDSG